MVDRKQEIVKVRKWERSCKIKKDSERKRKRSEKQEGGKERKRHSEQRWWIAQKEIIKGRNGEKTKKWKIEKVSERKKKRSEKYEDVMWKGEEDSKIKMVEGRKNNCKIMTVKGMRNE